MATVTYIKETKQSIGAMKGLISYCCQDKKTVDDISGQKLVSGINCSGSNAFTEFMTTKKVYGKTAGINFYQYVQSFSPQKEITPQKAHEIALDFASKAWQGHEILVTTHCDSSHIHSHFVINSVSFENGLKLRQDPNTLKRLRKLSDEICEQQHLSVLKPYENGGTNISTREYRAAKKGQSWKFQLMFAINQAMNRSGCKSEFIREMNRQGYKVIWTDNRKYITFICPNNMKCRDIKLHNNKYLKENLEYELQYRQSKYKRFGREFRSDERTLGHKSATIENAYDGGSAGEGLGYDGGSASKNGGISADSIQSAKGIANDKSNGKLPDGLEQGRTEDVRKFNIVDGNEAGNSANSGGEFAESDERNRVTGWEQARRNYERFLGTGQRAETGDSESFEEINSKNADHLDSEHGRSSVDIFNSVNSAVGSLARLINDEDDPEEKRKSIEAQKNGEAVGAVAGLVIGAVVSATEDDEPEQDDLSLTL